MPQLGNKGQIGGSIAGVVISLIMMIVIIGVIITNVATDTILGSSTTSFNSLQTIALTGFTIIGIGAIAWAGRWVMQIFQ